MFRDRMSLDEAAVFALDNLPYGSEVVVTLRRDWHGVELKHDGEEVGFVTRQRDGLAAQIEAATVTARKMAGLPD